MTQTERYRTDPEFRQRARAYAKHWQRNKLDTDPLYRRTHRFRCYVLKRKSAPGFIPLHEYEHHLGLCKARKGYNPEEAVADLRAEWDAIRLLYRKPTKVKGPPKPKKVVDPEIRRRNLLIFEANLQRQKDKAQAAQEYKEMMAAWKAKWWPILGRTSSRRKVTKKRRLARLRVTKTSRDPALLKQIEHIHYGPCVCFWCGRHLPKGGTVDHIIPLAKGGTHTSGNICASCRPCNERKADRTPEEAGLIGCFAKTPARVKFLRRGSTATPAAHSAAAYGARRPPSGQAKHA